MNQTVITGEILRQYPAPGLHLLDVEVDEKGITISGTVQNYYYKHLAEQIAGDVSDGRPVINEIRVHRPRKNQPVPHI